MSVALTKVAPRAPAAPVPPLARIEAHYRKFLQTRWIGLVVRSAVVTSIVFTVIPSVLVRWNGSLVSTLGTLALGPVVYLFSVHLVLQVRRSWIISPPQLPASASGPRLLLSSFTPRVLALVAAHWVLGLVFALAFASTLNARSNVQLGWLNPSPRYPWHGNERLWFLVLGNTMFFGGLAIRDVLKSRIGPFYPQNRLRFPDAVRRSLQAATPDTVADISLALTWSAAYSATYLLLRVWVWRTAVTYLPFLRPLAINFARSSRSNITYSLAWYLLVLQITTLLCLKPALAVINDYLCQPLPFSNFTRKSPLTADKYLLTALQTRNDWYLNLTILELQRVSHTPSRRKEIFADTSRPALTHEIYKSLLLSLGDIYASLTPQTAPAPLPKPSAPDTHSVTLQQGDIFKPTPKSTLRTFAASVLDSKPTPTPKPVIEAAHQVHTLEKAVVKQVEKPVQKAEAWAESTPVLGPLFSGVKLARGGFGQWSKAEWARRSLPVPPRLEWIVDTLVTFSVASAEEDTYGYVQGVMPSVLEALIRVRDGVESRGRELGGEDVGRQVGLITGIVDSGIRRIAERFGDGLLAFRFPQSVAAVLTEVCK